MGGGRPLGRPCRDGALAAGEASGLGLRTAVPAHSGHPPICPPSTCHSPSSPALVAAPPVHTAEGVQRGLPGSYQPSPPPPPPPCGLRHTHCLSCVHLPTPSCPLCPMGTGYYPAVTQGPPLPHQVHPGTRGLCLCCLTSADPAAGGGYPAGQPHTHSAAALPPGAGPRPQAGAGHSLYLTSPG